MVAMYVLCVGVVCGAAGDVLECRNRYKPVQALAFFTRYIRGEPF